MSKVEGLKVVRIEVRDVLGIKEFLAEPGKITMIEGRNEEGKTSVLRGVEAALGGGMSLARIARIPQNPLEEGDGMFPEVVLVLEGSDGLKYRVRRDDAGVSVERQVGDTEGYEDLKQPAKWLEKVWDGMGANPVSLVRAKTEKERTLLLLESLPLTFNYESFLALVGLDPADAPKISVKTHALEAVALARASVFEKRKGVNRDQKAKESAAEQTRRKVPASLLLNDGLDTDVQDQERLVTGLVRELGELETQAKADRTTANGTNASRQSAENAETNETANGLIAEARAAYDAAVAAAEQGRSLGLQNNAFARKQADDRAQASYDEALEALKEKRSEMMQARSILDARRAMKEDQAAGRALHDQAAQFDAEAIELSAEGKRLTAVLERIDTERAKLAENIPIEDLEIKDGEIMVGGIPFPQLNTAQQWTIAAKVSLLRSHDRSLKLVLIDGIESLDESNFAALATEIKRHGAQAILARVAESKLTVWTEGRA